MTGHVDEIKISKVKGAPWQELSKGVLRVDHGLEGDRHVGKGNQQVSLLAVESKKRNRRQTVPGLCGGKFVENITTEGIALHLLSVGARLKIGGALIEVTQIGKTCYAGCDLLTSPGACVLPKEGVFARVLKTGNIQVGDIIESINI